MVFGDRQLLQVTYSLIYFLSKLSTCFGFHRPLMIKESEPSRFPMVFISVKKKDFTCSLFLSNSVQIFVKLPLFIIYLIDGICDPITPYMDNPDHPFVPC